MKLRKFAAAVLASVLVASAQADHAAVVYCALDAKNRIRVLAADSPIAAKVLASVKRGAPCAQTLHDFMSKGYVITNTFSSSRSNLMGLPLRIEGTITPKTEKHVVDLDVEWHPVKPDRIRADEALDRATQTIVFVLTSDSH
jgi:hypothetical protein